VVEALFALEKLPPELILLEVLSVEIFLKLVEIYLQGHGRAIVLHVGVERVLIGVH
jgi:hypothetical protein